MGNTVKRFLSIFLSAVLFVAMLTGCNADKNAKEPKRIIAVSTNSFHGFGIEETLKCIAQTGFKYVEIAAVRNWTEHIMSDMSESEIEHIQSLAKDLGLSFIGMSAPCNMMDTDSLNGFKDYIALAHRLGCRYIISPTDESHSEEIVEFANDILVKNIRSILPLLEEYDLTLAVETHGEYGTGESIAQITREIASDRVGINYDTANVVYYGGVRPETEIAECIDQVKYVHLKDKIGFDDSWNFPALGKGELALDKFMDYLNDADCTAPYSIEIEYTEDFTMREKTPEDFATVKKALEDSYAYLHNLGLI